MNPRMSDLAANSSLDLSRKGDRGGVLSMANLMSTPMEGSPSG